MLEQIETDRLRLRPLENSDLDDVYEVQQNPGSIEHELGGNPRSRSTTELSMRQLVPGSAASIYGMFALVLRDSAEFIGYCGLHWSQGQHCTEIKYYLKRKFEGNGYATEAVSRVLAYGFKQGGKDRIIARIKPCNTASNKIAERCGMKVNGSNRSISKEMWQRRNDCGLIFTFLLYLI